MRKVTKTLQKQISMFGEEKLMLSPEDSHVNHSQQQEREEAQRITASYGPEMFRAIREIEPTWVVAENVPGILTIEGGLVFKRVCDDLENQGYKVQPFIIPAIATEKDHIRDRVWIIAYSERNNDRRKDRRGIDKKEGIQDIDRQEHCATGKFSGTTDITNQRGDFDEYDNTNSNVQGLEERKIQRENQEPKQSSIIGIYGNSSNSDRIGLESGFKISGGEKRINPGGSKESWFEAATRLCIVDDGLSGRLDGITVSKWRTESLKAAGNAIVPQIAFEIFKAIQSTI